ncbi:MAG: hypothetical protein RJA87_2128 [Pseudomonadota bacterium]|jgi:hypothetical protein
MIMNRSKILWLGCLIISVGVFLHLTMPVAARGLAEITVGVGIAC